ncbi:MAG: TetR/AcrR family transcriptional regulator [Rhizobacter sp.]|nr:TetR/AcrR family transcriptional regulator [Rhizobacter sp.]
MAKLARGRHPLTQQAVAESQRARLIDALPRVVAAKGYAAATVADVIALAGVSRRTFYELFAGLEDCFLAAYEHGMRQLFAAIREAVAPLPRADWRARTRAALRAYFETLATMPEATRTYSIEALGAGERVLHARAWVVEQWLAQWRVLEALRREAEPAAEPVDDAQLLAMTGGLEELVRHCVQHRGAEQLPSMVEPACRFALAVLQGGEPRGKPPAAAGPRRR